MSHPLQEFFTYQSADNESYERNYPHPLKEFFAADDSPNPHETSPQLQPKGRQQQDTFRMGHTPGLEPSGSNASSGIRGELERKVASPAVEFLTKAATSIPEFGKSISKLGMQGVNALLNQFGIGMSPEDFDQASKIIQSIGPFGQVPNESQISQGVKDVTGGRLEPTTAGERVLKGGAGILGSIAGFGPSGTFGTPLKTAGSLAMAGTTAGLEETGSPPWAALGGGILADILTRSGGNVLKKLAGIPSKGIAKTAGEISSKMARLSPSDIKKELVEAGERLGIPQAEIPLSAQLNSPAIRSVETKLRESSLSGKHLEKQLENVESKTRNAYQDISNKISTRQNLLPAAVSEEAISQLKNVEKNAEEVYESFYNQAKKNLPESATIEASTGKKFYQMLDGTIKKLSGGSGNPSKDAVVSRLTRLKNDWKQRFPDGNIPVKDVIEQKKDFNKIIKYETKGGEDKIMKPLNYFTKNAIQEYGKKNQPFLARFNQAETRFGKAAQDFRKNDAVRSLLDTQNPQQILTKMKNVKTYRELKNLYDRTPEGKESFSDLSRYLLEDIIGSKLLNKEGKMSWGNASGIFKTAKNREILQEIVGKDSYDKLKDISKFSHGIEEGLRKFANSSGTATKGLDIALILGTLGKGAAHLMSGNVIKAGQAASLFVVPRVMAKVMSNPEFIQAMVDTASAAKGKNPNVFFEAAERAARFAIPAIIEANEEEPQSHK